MATLKSGRVPRTTNKDVNKLLQLVVEQWGEDSLGSTKKHIKVYPPNKKLGIVIIPVTSSGGSRSRAYQNVKSELKRKGLKIEH